MSEEMSGSSERRTAQGVVPASSPRSSSSKETVARGKQQWRGGPRRNYPGGQYPDSQGSPNSRGRYDNRNAPQYRRLTPDKRQAVPRGRYQDVVNKSYNAGEVDMAVDDASERRTPTSKKLVNSLNYLLNFKYTPRERGYDQRARCNSKKHSSFNKERFLQANCQFIVSDSADYTVYAIDADILVDWSLIEQVRIFSHEVPSCPICLYSPKAAKITRCGHVYCWSCILHYLSLSDNPWRKCPICFESITKKDLKSVVAMESHHFATGQTITMRLMKKMKNTTVALPKSQWEESEMKPIKINDAVDTCYCKILLASQDDVLKQIIETEETVLNVQLSEAKLEESSEICFIESALIELKARKDGLQDKQNALKEVSEALERMSVLSPDDSSVDNKQNHTNGWNVYRKDSNTTQESEEFEPAFSDEEDTATDKNISDVVSIDATGQSLEVTSVDSKKRKESDKTGNDDQETVNQEINTQMLTSPLSDKTQTPTSPLSDKTQTPTSPLSDKTQMLTSPLSDKTQTPTSPVSDKDSSDSLSDLLNDQETVSQEVKTPISPSEDSSGSSGELTANKGSSTSSQDHVYTYFYQADDGQNVFLHPINARCLIKEYGSLEECPEYISAQILEMEAMSQTEEARKRYRYLSHLPLTCEFVICEVDLKSPVVSSRTLEHFRVEIQKRKQRRQKKIKVEKRREMKVDAKVASIEGRPINSGRRSQPLNLTSDVDFPTQSSPTLAMSPLGHRPGPFTQLVTATTSYNDQDDESESAIQEASGMSPPSFAQALRTGKAVEFSKPVRKQRQEEVKRNTNPTDGLDNDSDEDYIPPPTYQSTFFDAISIAIGENLDKHLKADVTQATPTVSGGKRKKKTKKKLLFTTGHMKFN